MKSKLEIINDTVAFYAEAPKDRRAGPAYRTTDGRMCAVGRCLIDPIKAQTGGMAVMRHLEGLLRPEYRGHELGFWFQLRAFHDRHAYWTDTDLSEQGRAALAELREQHA